MRLVWYLLGCLVGYIVLIAIFVKFWNGRR